MRSTHVMTCATRLFAVAASCLLLVGAACRAPEGATAVAVGPDGRLELDLAPQLGLRLSGVTFRIHAGGAWVDAASCEPPTRQRDGTATVISYRCGDPAAAFALDLGFTPAPTDPDALVLSPTVRALGGPQLAVEALELRVDPGGLQLPALGDQLLFLQNGYQSWSFTGAVQLDAPFTVDAADEQRYAAASGDVLKERKGVGWWFGAVAGAAHEPALALGAASARRLRTAIVPTLAASGQGGLVLRIGTQGERLPLAADDRLALEQLVLAGGATVEEALGRYVRAVAAQTPALADASGLSPTGWWSWNELFDAVTADRVLAHAELLQRELASAGFGLIVLDDGYMVRWGDWEQTDPERFPSGLPALATEVRRRGLEVGLWLAPFLVDEDSPLVAEHPAWFVREAGGQPLVHNLLGLPGPMRVLDVTHPEAAAHLRALFARLAEMGFALFKLDFLYAGALPGLRYRRDATGIEALGEGLAAIHEAVPAAHLNLCGVPVLPAVGRGHSLRTGADIAFKSLPIRFTQLAHEARNVMARAVLDPLIRNDPDQVLVREPLTLAEAQVAATLGALTGFFAAGDDLLALSPERRAVLTHPGLREIAAHGRSARPLGLFDAAADTIYATPLLDNSLDDSPRTALPTRLLFELDEEEAYLALFNWKDAEQPTTVDLAQLGRAGAAVLELWSDRSLPRDGGIVSLSLAGHSVALLHLEGR